MQSGRGKVCGCVNDCTTPPKVWMSFEISLRFKKTTFYTISSKKWWEYYFSVSNKAFFWTRGASLKISLRSIFKPKPLGPRKMLCFRLKSILITFLYKQYRNNYFYTVCREKRWEYFSVENKVFFWAQMGSVWSSSEARTLRKPFVSRKMLCLRLKSSILIVFSLLIV